MATISLLRLTLRPPTTATTTTLHRHNHLSLKPTPPSKPLKTRKTGILSSLTTTPATERIISAVGYVLPFINGLQYGRFLLAQYPSLTVFLQPFLPVFSLLKTVPYASFVAFFALYLGVVRNTGLSRYVRFNAMQALVLDVLLVLPMLLQRIFSPGRGGFGYKLMVMGHNGVFVFLVFCFVYSFVCSLLGKTPFLPFVADAAGRQL